MRSLPESLVHGLALGPIALGGYWLFADHGTALEQVVIDGTQVDSIRTQFREVWSRYPTDAELGRLVQVAARDEILYREGETLGIGRDAPDVKERIRQKYEALAEAEVASHTPTDAELDDWLKLHAARYAAPATVTYSQILLVEAGTPGDPEYAARRAQIRLNRGARAVRVGLPSSLPAKVWHIRLDAVADDFGASFADALTRLPPRVWQGPVLSRYGAHLVRVESVMPGALPPLEDVREAVTRDYLTAERQRALEATLEAARQKYEVIVEPHLSRQAAN
jgi:hypothetical protein